ncbi:TruB family pseudouridylate synthase containing protein [Metarhizium acridum CQMa 102]|uniref:tRNA pseudouridine(55) synthase n=1 Tax=Metarhizium acridum (strain CQMa 102) TaxID=655827 RepID=E9E5T4_METAQ|nr:TruB family pseudouridylate synthase containing protein [Metarhizium acridum CQMa 102]EFY88797.1 TruB family pseudouridylate synthase containing protein [Metarhizium acridum CQMa 102]
MASDVVRDGVFAINKPCGQSSAQVVRECQQAFNPSTFFRPMIEAELARRLKESGKQFNRRKAEKKASQVKIGHGGTLDPLATGVLILGIGSGTKVLSQFLDCTKTYETTVVFGVSTDTYDRVGRVLSRKGYDHVTRELVEKELESFRGKQTQIPPLYSALKMNGKPLYEYAREGKPIPREIESRQVEALEVELVEWYEPGKHNHRWPTEEAEAAERNLAEQVWRVKKQQETGKTLTPEEKEQDDQAITAHETFKRRFEERQDELIKDSPLKKSRHRKDCKALMSGALGQMPQPVYSNKGSNLVPATPDSSTPPPWNDEGPPACKIRLTVSSGYYVRSFCHDLGSKLGSAAIMAELCRVRQSDFTVGGTNTLEYDDLGKGEEVWGPKVADMLARWNGEPEGNWPGRQTSPKPDHDKLAFKKQQKRRLSTETDSPSRQDKRRRSPSSESAEPPRKTTRTSPSAAKPTLKAATKSDDEKSWHGIED